MRGRPTRHLKTHKAQNDLLVKKDQQARTTPVNRKEYLLSLVTDSFPLKGPVATIKANLDREIFAYDYSARLLCVMTVN